VGHDVDAPASIPAVIDRVQATFGGDRTSGSVTEGHTRIRYEQTNRSDVSFNRCDERRHGCFIANVDRVGDTTYLTGNGTRCLFVQVNDHDIDIISGKSATQRTANAVSAARDYRDSHNLSLSV
jgi:hypothetical protein